MDVVSGVDSGSALGTQPQAWGAGAEGLPWNASFLWAVPVVTSRQLDGRVLGGGPDRDSSLRLLSKPHQH